MKYQMIPATTQHVTAMLPHVRLADRQEVYASSGQPLEVVLPISVSLSRQCWAGLIDERVVCLFGVSGATLLSLTGHPWLIATHEIESHATAFLRRSRVVITAMLGLFPHLLNYVDVRNTHALTWLTWLGFEMSDPEPFGYLQLPFHRFEMSRHV